MQSGESPSRSQVSFPHQVHESLTSLLAVHAAENSEHIVQFYEHDDSLIDTVSLFVANALHAGQGAVLFATEAHRSDLEAAIMAREVDLDGARDRGQYLLFEAGQTLSQIVRDGVLDAERFQSVIGTVISDMTKKWPRVRAFGELVTLLWKDGHQDAARRLEASWDQLTKQHPLSLLCAYPVNSFAGGSGAALFAEVGASHSRVIHPESHSQAGSQEEQLRAISDLQQQVKALELEAAECRRIEREHTDFLHNSLECLHKVGPDGIILWANQAELDLLGYLHEEYVGRHIADFHVDQEVIEEIIVQLSAGENILNRAARLRCKDGQIKHVLIHSNAYFEDGELVYTRCFTRDVSDSRQADRDRALLAAIIDSSEDAIVSKDLNGVITSWNQGAERLFGYTPQEAIGQPVSILIPKDRQDEEPQILSRLRQGERISHFETIRRRKDGTLINISLAISPIIGSDGRIIGASKIARDITQGNRT